MARIFEEAVRVSEAMQQAARRGGGALVPALSGCEPCGAARMIAAPTLGYCDDCGAELTLLGAALPNAENPAFAVAA